MDDPNSDSSITITYFHSIEGKIFRARANDGRERQFAFIYPPDVGIKIATKNRAKYAAMREASFLAKEQMTEMLMLRVGSEIAQTGAFAFSDLQGNPITDPKTLRDAGLTLVVKQGNDPNSDLYKILDVLPILMLSLEIRDMKDKGNFLDIQAFETAADFLKSNPKVEQRVRELSAEWAKSGSLLGGAGVTNLLFSSDAELIPKIYELFKLLYPTGASPLK